MGGPGGGQEEARRTGSGRRADDGVPYHLFGCGAPGAEREVAVGRRRLGGAPWEWGEVDWRARLGSGEARGWLVCGGSCVERPRAAHGPERLFDDGRLARGRAGTPRLSSTYAAGTSRSARGRWGKRPEVALARCGRPREARWPRVERRWQWGGDGLEGASWQWGEVAWGASSDERAGRRRSAPGRAIAATAGPGA